MVNHTDIEKALRLRIADGTLPVGSKIPTERSLAEEFGASRNTIRKAIKSLQRDSLIAARANSRSVVVRPNKLRMESSSPSLDLKSMDRSDEADMHTGDEYISASSPLEVLEARLVIEPEAVALAALRARKDNIDEIQHALAESLAATSLMDFEYWDGQLHQAIFYATRNTALIGYYHTINKIRSQASWIVLKKKSLTPERRRLYDRQHAAIVDTIINRHTDKARSSMRAHLESVRKAMMP